MSLHHYTASREIVQARHENDWPFYALIMAAMREADSGNLLLLRNAWPEVYADLQARYWAPGGVLPGDIVPPTDQGDTP